MSDDTENTRMEIVTDEDEEGASEHETRSIGRPSQLQGDQAERLYRANEITAAVMRYLLSLSDPDSVIITAAYQVAANIGWGAVKAGAFGVDTLHRALDDGLAAAELNYHDVGKTADA